MILPSYFQIYDKGTYNGRPCQVVGVHFTSNISYDIMFDDNDAIETNVSAGDIIPAPNHVLYKTSHEVE